MSEQGVLVRYAGDIDHLLLGMNRTNGKLFNSMDYSFGNSNIETKGFQTFNMAVVSKYSASH